MKLVSKNKYAKWSGSHLMSNIRFVYSPINEWFGFKMRQLSYFKWIVIVDYVKYWNKKYITPFECFESPEGFECSTFNEDSDRLKIFKVKDVSVGRCEQNHRLEIKLVHKQICGRTVEIRCFRRFCFVLFLVLSDNCCRCHRHSWNETILHSDEVEKCYFSLFRIGIRSSYRKWIESLNFIIRVHFVRGTFDFISNKHDYKKVYSKYERQQKRREKNSIYKLRRLCMPIKMALIKTKNVDTEARAKNHKTDFIASNSTFIIILSTWTSAYINNWFFYSGGFCIRCWNNRFINCCQLCAYQWANKQKCSVSLTIKYSKSDGFRFLCETKTRSLVYCGAKRN